VEEKNNSTTLLATLHSPRPNPTCDFTTISYSLSSASHTSVKIYNFLGNEICTLVDEFKPKGKYSTVWNGKNKKNLRVASGIYFCELLAGTDKYIQQIIFLKK